MYATMVEGIECNLTFRWCN